MSLPPVAISALGAIGLIVVPSVVILASNALAYRARRYAARRWQADIDADRRQEEQAARAWVDLYDRHESRVSDLERRVTELESDRTAMSSVVSKVERSMRRRNLLDSTRPGQLPR